MPARKYLALALMIGMLLGYGWQSIVTSIVLSGIGKMVKKGFRVISNTFT
jgi:hypothetical protein